MKVPAIVCPWYSLEGRSALITGAGRGIGAATAELLAAAGASVVLVSRTQPELEAVVTGIQTRGGSASFATCDVCDAAQVTNLVASLSRLDILVNNAGGNIPENFVDVSTDHLDKLLNLNVRSAFVVAQASTRKMLEQPIPERMEGGSSIVHITSQMGRVGAPGRSVYCMTKHAIEGLSKAMAVELASQGIRVNAVAPTFLETSMTAPFFAADPRFSEWVMNRIPVGRLGNVHEVARTVLFLASPAASMITGESVAVDGGWTAQ